MVRRSDHALGEGSWLCAQKDMDRGVRPFPAHVLMCLGTRSWRAAPVRETGGTLIVCRPEVHDWKDFTDGLVLAVQGTVRLSKECALIPP
jgi:hypothetical protein